MASRSVRVVPLDATAVDSTAQQVSSREAQTGTRSIRVAPSPSTKDAPTAIAADDSTLSTGGTAQRTIRGKDAAAAPLDGTTVVTSDRAHDGTAGSNMAGPIVPAQVWPIGIDGEGDQDTQQREAEQLLRAGESFSLGNGDDSVHHVVRFIAAGAFGEVYEMELGGQYRAATKVAKLDNTQPRSARNKFILDLCKEAGLAIRLGGHPNIVRCYGIQVGMKTHANEVFVSMQLLGEGCATLQDVMARWNKEYAAPGGDVSRYSDRVRQVSVDIYRGLAWMHSQLVLHQDVKPQNVMVDADGTCLLTDMGLAARGEISESDGILQARFCGCSLLWASPEVWKAWHARKRPVGGDSTAPAPTMVSPATHDLWSAAVIVLQLFLRQTNPSCTIVSRFLQAVNDAQAALPDAPLVSWSVDQCSHWLSASGLVPGALIQQWKESGRNGSWLAGLPYSWDPTLDPDKLLKLGTRKKLLHRIQVASIPLDIRSMLCVSFADNAVSRHQHARDILAAIGQDPISGEECSPQSLAASLYTIAQAHELIGVYDPAIPLLEESLVLTKNAVGHDHPAVASVQGLLALVFKDLGKYDQALPLYQNSVEIYRNSDGVDSSALARCIQSMAVLHETLGEYDQAMPLLQESLNLTRQAKGPGHRDVADALMPMSRLYASMHDGDRAVRAAEEAVEIYKRTLGPPHGMVGTALGELGRAYLEKGDLERAQSHLEESLELARRHYGDDNPTTATALNNLAAAHAKQKHYDQAESLLQRCLDIRTAHLPAGHSFTLESLGNLATIYQAQGQHDRAIELFQKSLDGLRSALGETNIKVANALGLLAHAHMAKRNLKQALTLFEQSLEVVTLTAGAKHPMVAAIQWDMAEIHMTQGNNEQAMLHLMRCKNLLHMADTPQDQLLAKCLGAIGRIHYQRQHFDNARVALEEEVGIRRRAADKDPSGLRSALSGLAAVCKALEQHDRAMSLFQEALELGRRTIGEDHPDMAETLHNFAMLYLAQNDFEHAIPLMEKSFPMFKQLLGPSHPTVGISACKLAQCYLATRQPDKGIPLYKEGMGILQSTGHPAVMQMMIEVGVLAQAFGGADDMDNEACVIM